MSSLIFIPVFFIIAIVVWILVSVGLLSWMSAMILTVFFVIVLFIFFALIRVRLTSYLDGRMDTMFNHLLYWVRSETVQDTEATSCKDPVVSRASQTPNTLPTHISLPTDSARRRKKTKTKKNENEERQVEPSYPLHPCTGGNCHEKRDTPSPQADIATPCTGGNCHEKRDLPSPQADVAIIPDGGVLTPIPDREEVTDNSSSELIGNDDGDLDDGLHVEAFNKPLYGTRVNMVNLSQTQSDSHSSRRR